MPQQALVLLIDDEHDLRVAMKRFLLRGGYQVETASSGDEAIEALRQGRRFDVIISDLRMPGLHGAELVRAVRTFDAHVPIIILTGALDPACEKELKGGGAFDCLEKPVDAPVLLDAVGDAMIESAKWKVA